MEYLAIRPEGIYLDATTGLGGHTREIARRLTTGFAIANDRDAESLEFARANTRGIRGSDPLSMRQIFGFEKCGSGAGRRKSERPAGGPGSEPLSVDRTAQGFLDLDRWSAGHAHGPKPAHDGGRPGQFCRRKGNRRLDLPTRRRKEGAEDSQSNRSGTAHTEHTAPGRCSGAGRAPDGPPASRHANLHGAADGGQRRAGRARPVAGIWRPA